MKKQFKILILLLLIPIIGFSFNNDFGFTKQKSIKKSYHVNSDATISIDNSYGKISIATWDEDQVEIDILIKVSGNKEDWVNKRLNDITVDLEALKSKVTAKTIIENSGSYNNCNNSFEINYVIKIPKKGNLILNNKYGDIFATNLFGNVNLNCKYGKINLGKLTGITNNINIEYCNNSEIDYVLNANIIAKYSQLKIIETKGLILSSDYTDVAISESQNINYTCKYGSLKFENVNSIQGKGNYLTIKVVNLFGDLNLDTKYSTININKINSKSGNINIEGGYNGVNIGFSENYFFDFDISGKYLGFKKSKDFEFSNSEEDAGMTQYIGFYKRKGLNKIKISSNYGTVKFTKNTN